MQTIPAKTIVSGYAGDNPHWFGVNYNMNIYRGCPHGCIYCDSRSLCYRNPDFGTVKAKENAIETIKRELKAKRKKGVIGTGAMSDPYNPFEKTEQLTRQALELIAKYGFGIAVATKSPLITRDIDLFKEIQRKNDVLLKITITAASDDLSKKVEPNVAPSSQRFAAIKQLTDNGIFTGILLMPVLPFIEDTEENITALVKQAGRAGAKFIFAAMGMTNREGQREYFYKALDEKFPGLKEKYIKAFGSTYECHAPKAKELFNLFKEQCEKHGILYKMTDIIKGYRTDKSKVQGTLF